MYNQWSSLTELDEEEVEQHHQDFTEEHFDTFCIELEVLNKQVLEKIKLFAQDNPGIEIDIPELRQPSQSPSPRSPSPRSPSPRSPSPMMAEPRAVPVPAADENTARKKCIEIMIPGMKAEIGDRMTAITGELAKDPVVLTVKSG